MSFSIRVPSLITPVYCIKQTEEPKTRRIWGKILSKLYRWLHIFRPD
ncbi:hypothetical protein BH695_4129 [Microcystis aeruginosa PCC 7806SL]|uniref:Uncharacterized protein n=1 Tax=Microcystis aeruginosa PCC 7806SL TaxID=1903187 RepID=A0AB33C8B6_MICA7|nr:hypothetical protein BH695_4129 [Microcystis aeruginosa PCC 7806SL]